MSGTSPNKYEATSQAYRDVFCSPQGLLVLEDLFNTLGMLNTVIVAGDPLSTGFNEGRRTVYMEILKRVEIDYTAMAKRSISGKSHS